MVGLIQLPLLWQPLLKYPDRTHREFCRNYRKSNLEGRAAAVVLMLVPACAGDRWIPYLLRQDLLLLLLPLLPEKLLFLLLHHMELRSLLHQHLLHDGCLGLAAKEVPPGAGACGYAAGACRDRSLHGPCGPWQSHLVLLCKERGNALLLGYTVKGNRSWPSRGGTESVVEAWSLEKDQAMDCSPQGTGSSFLLEFKAPQVKQEHFIINWNNEVVS